MHGGARVCEKARIKHFFDVGEMGTEHALLPEKGLVGSGDLVVGADSHTCTYGRSELSRQAWARQI